MEHQGTVLLETERLILRKFTFSDIEASFDNWTNDKLTTKYLTWQPHETIGVTEDIIQQWINKYDDLSFYQWAVEWKKEKEVIGTISVVGLNETVNSVEIGYCIGSQWWNQGIMSEAFDIVISFLFEHVNVKRIEACHDINNPASGKVMEKCGLIYEGTLRQALRNNRGVVDIAIYSILSSDYNTR